MATLLKKKTADSKGIIVFTHKERNWFLSNPNVSPNPLKKDYLLGIHYGWHSPSQSKTFEDFYMGDDQQVSYIGQAPFKIPLNSRNFTPECFWPREQDDTIIWDVICVSRAAKFKKLPLLLESLNLFKPMGYFKSLIIVPTASNEDEGYDKDIVKKYHSLKNDNITLLRLSKEHGFMGANKNFIAEMMRQSHSFILLSEEEGESRVISEALCCGCNIIVYKHLRGGGQDFLNQNNSILFSEFTPESISQAIKNSMSFYPPSANIVEESAKNLNEKFTKQTLKNFISLLYRLENLNSFDGCLEADNLNIRLPAHDQTVPWFKGGNGQTADILSEQQFKTFMEYLNAQ